MIDSQAPVKDFMTTDPITIDAGLTVVDACDRMSERHIRHLPVIRDGLIVGVLSARDVLLVEELRALKLNEILVETAMSGQTVAVTPDTPIAEVLTTMTERRIGAVVVKDDNGLAGIFTDADAVGLLKRSLVPA